MSGSYFTACCASSSDLNDVVSIPRSNEIADAANFSGKCGFLKRVEHLKGREPAQITPVVLHAGVVGSSFGTCDGIKVFAIGDPGAQSIRSLPCFEGVRCRSFTSARHQNVACVDFFLFAFPSLEDEILKQVIVGHIGPRQLRSISCQFALESRYRIHPQCFRSLNFQLESNEQFHVLIQ